MENNEYRQVQEEEKQDQDRQEYQNLLDEFEGGLQDLLLQANKDNITTNDILQTIKEMIEDTQDIKVKIERV